jgi:hypothetical protein
MAHYRQIAEQKIGRKLLPGEHVHHRDGDRSNNHPRNLDVMTASEHSALHALLRSPLPYYSVHTDSNPPLYMKGVASAMGHYGVSLSELAAEAEGHISWLEELVERDYPIPLHEAHALMEAVFRVNFRKLRDSAEREARRQARFAQRRDARFAEVTG